MVCLSEAVTSIPGTVLCRDEATTSPLLQRMNGFPSWVLSSPCCRTLWKLSQVSSMVYMGYYISHRSSLSPLSGWGRQQFPPHLQGRLHCLLHPAVFYRREVWEGSKSLIPSYSWKELPPWPCWPDTSIHRVRGFKPGLPSSFLGSFFF